MRVTVLHPGDMGSVIGGILVGAGHVVTWLPEGRGQTTRERAERAGLIGVPELGDCDVVLSVCPPAAAESVARLVSGFTGVYVDANAISPATAARVRELVTAAGATYVDGGIIGPPPTTAGTTRLYLSGDAATQAAALFAGSELDARVLTSGGPYAASALKMSYAAWTKISAALLVEIRSAASALDVGDALEAEWALSQPDAPERADRAVASARRNGWRWSGEMLQIAETFDSAGSEPGFGNAAARVFERYQRP